MTFRSPWRFFDQLAIERSAIERSAVRVTCTP
jgi:hypothetical protein